MNQVLATYANLGIDMHSRSRLVWERLVPTRLARGYYT